MTLEIDSSVYEAMILASNKALPIEACGLLAGSDGRATKLYELTNADASAKHFSFLPEEQFAAIKDMRSCGMEMLAIWHSHPDTPARMSEEDLRLALTPGVVYVILSMMDGLPAMRGFEPDEGVAISVPVEIVSCGVKSEADECDVKAPRSFYSLPADLSEDIEQHAADVARFLDGDLLPGVLKARRVPRGMYEQRQDGTFMIRVRVAGGSLTTDQARALADLSREFGNGKLHVTTRQDVQIHDVDIKDTPDILRRLMDAGLSSKGGGGNTVRNVTACPYAGTCCSELFDVTPFSYAVTQYLIGLPGSYKLPRKYKIAFSGCGADCALAQVNDLGFIAKEKDGAPGFALYVGGGMGAKSRTGDTLDAWVPAKDVIRVAETVRRLFDRMGDRHNRQRARLRFVLDRIGAEAFRGDYRDELKRVEADSVPDCTVEAAVRKPEKQTPPEEEFGAGGSVRFMRQRQDGYAMVRIYTPMGFILSEELARLADTADRFSSERALRTVQVQDFLLRYVKEEDLPDLKERLVGEDYDFISARALNHFISCAGASTCRMGLCLSRNATEACADAIDRSEIDLSILGDDGINISGCANACGQHPIAAIGFHGVTQRKGGRLVPSYRVSLGAQHVEPEARLSSDMGAVPARALPAFLVDLLKEFQAGQQDREGFACFYDRMGGEHFKALVKRHCEIPEYDDNSDFYRDWGSDEDFSLAGRGAGECGAGVFELIKNDIAEARRAVLSASATEGSGLFGALLPAVRALLITRGIDTVKPEEIFSQFAGHFMDTGLVHAEYRSLLTRAEEYMAGETGSLDGTAKEVSRLIDSIDALYSTLDSSLQFHPSTVEDTVAPDVSQAAPEAQDGNAGTVEIDLCGVACPMNFVKAKLRLESMQIGEMLGIVLDEGEPVRNVPESFRGEGQEVVDMARLDGEHWRVVIKKKR
ncbi:MAG: Mov34/MPN/PAD-1 family protein [Kiritimatiellia bacterium]|jgi:sulfite reductase (ferredoxin)|nr:Mov34/MPN/PAD-1 family protein [Kiritimatiellia bacterium]MDP6848714.1 Mov34/MPN/PAD-1 family protein [Kiritimatiellia bacterium]